jgi:CBS domain containing-hemolysin-like protein
VEIIFQIVLVFLLVFLNGFFVASEFSLVAIRKTRIAELVKKKNRSAGFVQKALDNLNTFISATQLGITLSSLALGWIGEPAIAHMLEPMFRNFLPEKAAFFSSHGVAFVIAFAIITSLHIVLGELAPKTIALQRAEKTVLWIIAPLLLFTTVFRPFIWVLNEAGFLVLRLAGFRVKEHETEVHSEEEIKMILAQSAKEGAIEQEEAEMVYSVLRFGDLPVKQVMIPRRKIIAFDAQTPLEKVVKIAENNLHSRFPVYKGTIDNVIGFMHIKDIYRQVLTDTKLNFVSGLYKLFLKKDEGARIFQTKLTRDILKVKESRRIDDVLLDMRKKRVHIAVVTDKNRRTIGIATLEDIIESLVGEIHDEFEAQKKK